MKKTSVKKEVLIVMMILVALFVISSRVLATGTSDSPVQIPIVGNSEEPEDTNSEAQTTNQVTPTANQITTNSETTSNLPQTGDASDYAIFMLIIVAVVIAGYAYKKVKDYNIK